VGLTTGTYVLVTGGENIVGLAPASVNLATGLTATVQRSPVTACCCMCLPHAVTYNGNGNTGGTAPVDGNSPYQPNATVTVLGNTGSLVKTGYTYQGWNTATNGSGTAYTPGETFTIVLRT
jgi:hypothetical protein